MFPSVFVCMWDESHIEQQSAKTTDIYPIIEYQLAITDGWAI